MTYGLLIVPIAAITIVVTLVSALRPGFGRRVAASAIAAVVLVALTAVFDNVMILSGLFTYPDQHVSGLRVGVAPLEDFAYPVCAAFLVPALFALYRRRSPR